MGIDFKEVAATRTDMKKYKDGWDNIFGGEKVALDFEEDFNLYRKERIKKECSVCSDLYHGYREGRLELQSQLKETEALLREACTEIKLLCMLSLGALSSDEFLNKTEIKKLMESK